MHPGYRVFIAPLKKEKKSLLIIGLALLVLSFSQSTFVLLLGPFLKGFLTMDSHQIGLHLNSIFPKSLQAYLPAEFDRLIDRAGLFKIIAFGLISAALLRSIAVYFYQVSTASLALKVAKSFRDQFFANLLSRPYLYISQKPASEWMSYLMNDVVFLQTSFTDVVNSLLRDGVVVLSAFTAMLLIHWQTGLVLLVIGPIIAMGMGRTGGKIAYYADEIQKRLASLTNFVLQLRQRYTFVRAQGGEGFELEHFTALNRGYYSLVRQSLLIRSSFAPVMEFIGFGLFAALIALISGASTSYSLSADQILVFFACLGLMFRPLRSIGEQLVKYKETMGALERSISVLKDSADSKILPTPKASKEQEHEYHDATYSEIESHDSLFLKRLEVSYDGQNVDLALDSCRILSGQSIAIIGPSGGGKSTLIKCLGGLISPSSWSANVSWVEYIKRVSMVSQAPFLFQETLMENLTYGNRNSINKEDLWLALDRVKATSEVENLDGVLDYQVRSIGQNLSGGQVQRLVLARALLRKSKVLVLDEATSAVSHEVERALTRDLIKACREDRSSLVAVTHRLQCLPDFDQVWFVDQGKVAFTGRHEELMANNSRYREFYGSTESN